MAPGSDFGRRGGAIFTGESPFFGRPPGFEARAGPGVFHCSAQNARRAREAL
jgi:hypothetical protein